MTNQEAITLLNKSGFKAVETCNGKIEILDPVLILSGSNRRTEFKKVNINAKQVSKFILDRS